MKLEKILALCLAAAVPAAVLATPAAAAAPTVSTDEAVYVNLDYYGKTEKTNIVKGVSLNGLGQFTDYGSYAQVTNMTDGTKPAVSGDSVSWKIPENTGRFYYECTPKSNSVTLPWSFDVAYKLNGVPAAAGQLAGKSGLVEIDVHAIPNKNAPEYYRDNMLLQIGTVFEMKDTQSLEAPGAQVQSLGDYKAVVFAAVPGEDKTCTIRIGTDSFETYGMVMLMIPGTLDRLHDIKDLKDDKDTVKGSLDAIKDGSDQILDTLSAMTGGLIQTQAGLGVLNDARGTISSGKGKVYKNADQALADLTAASKQTAALVPHLQKGQQLVEEVNTDVNQLTGTIDGISPQLGALSADLGTVKRDLSDLRDALDDLDDLSEDRGTTISELKSVLQTLNTDMATLKTLTADLPAKTSALSGSTQDLSDTLSYIAANTPVTDSLSSAIKAITGASSPALADLADLLGYSSTITYALNQLAGQSGSITAAGNDLIDVLDEYLEALDDGHDAADDLLKNSNHVGSDIQSLLTTCQTAIKDIDTLNATGNKYKDDSVAALKDTASLMTGLSDGLASSSSFLSSLEALMQTGGDQLDSGTKSTLSGLIQLLQKSLDGVGKTSVIKNAGGTIQDTLDNEIDKFENKNNLLNLDTDAKPVSFTSSKNAAPSSIQVVMRTEEIKLDKDNTAIKDYEASSQDQGPWVRIGNLFSELWKAITSLFKHS